MIAATTAACGDSGATVGDAPPNGSDGPRVIDAMIDGPPGARGLVFGSLIGGTNFDRAQGVYVDAAGYIYLGGNTGSGDFPVTAGAFDVTKNGAAANTNVAQDGWVAKLAPDASQILWATYLGGTARDQIYGVRVDAAGNVYVVGGTGSSDFPTTAGAFDTTFNGGGPTAPDNMGDVFVAKLSADGGQLLYSTYVGGSGDDGSRGDMFLRSDGTLVVTGHSSSPNFPLAGTSFQTMLAGQHDAFVFRLSADGGSLVASTYFGGSADDAALSGVFVLADGSAIIAGGSASANLPTTAGAYQRMSRGPTGSTQFTDGDGFVAKLSEDLSTVLWATYLGGTAADYLLHNQGLVVDAQGRAIVLGSTRSTDLPTTAGAFRTTPVGGEDGFVSILSADGANLVASTYVGGSMSEEVSGITVDGTGRVYLSGNTPSTDWPVTADAHQTAYGGGTTDVMLTVLSPDLTSLVYSTYYGGGTGMAALGERGRGVWLTGTAVVISGDTDSADFPTTPGVVDRTHSGNNDGFVLKFSM